LNIPLDRWVSYWKRLFTQRTRNPEWTWQSLHWDTRLRRSESYTRKWHYVRENPVRKGLVTNADAWPFQGMLNVLPW
jgi:putative transposase